MKVSPTSFDRFAGLQVDIQPLRAAVDGQGRLTAGTADSVLVDQGSGEVVKSPGSSAYHSAARATGEVIKGVFEYVHPSGQRSLIVRTHTGYYLSNSARTSWSSLQATPNQPAAVPSFAQVGNYLLMIDGEQAYYWDGVSSSLGGWRGHEGPTAGPILGEWRPKVTAESGGSLAANTTYAAHFVFYNSTTAQYSPPATYKTQPTDSTNKTLRVHTGYAKVGNGNTADGEKGSGFGRKVLPSGTTHVYAYLRLASETTGDWYRAGTYTVGQDTEGDEITVDITATSSSNAYSAFGGPPGGVNVVVEHAGRAFVCGSPAFPNRIWWSLAGDPLHFCPNNWHAVGQANDPVVALVSFPFDTSVLGILKRNSVWALSGYDETTFVAGLRQVTSGPGCLAPHGVIRVGLMAYFWGSGGFCRFDGQAVEPIDSGIRSKLRAAIKGT